MDSDLELVQGLQMEMIGQFPPTHEGKLSQQTPYVADFVGMSHLLSAPHMTEELSLLQLSQTLGGLGPRRFLLVGEVAIHEPHGVSHSFLFASSFPRRLSS